MGKGCKLNGKPVRCYPDLERLCNHKNHGVLIKTLCPYTCGICQTCRNVDDSARRRNGLPCTHFTEMGDCAYAPTSRRRSYGGEAKDHCTKTCGVCRYDPCGGLSYNQCWEGNMYQAKCYWSSHYKKCRPLHH